MPMCTNLSTLACFAAASTFFVPFTVTYLDNNAGVSGRALDHLSKDGPQPRLTGHVHADDSVQWIARRTFWKSAKGPHMATLAAH